MEWYALLLLEYYDVLDLEELKKMILRLEKDYDKITFGLKIVKEHNMGHMKKCISELSSLHYASDK